MDKKSYLGKFLNEPIAILCCRYWYRGIVTEVGDDSVILSDPSAIEVTGRATSATPQTEDKIPSDILISFDAIELICQPTWCFHGYKTKK